MDPSPASTSVQSSSNFTNHPSPGPAGIRAIWDGEKAAPPPSYLPTQEPGMNSWSAERAFGPAFANRITGLDAARGCALVGMIAVHILPAYNTNTGRPNLFWEFFAGNASALFAVLAGVTVVLLTGGNNPPKGRRMARSRVSLGIRAIIIFVLGMSIDHFDVYALNILPYYGLMFLLAIPLTALRIRSLLLLAVVFAIAGPFAVFFTNSQLEYTTTYNPSFSDLWGMPIDTLITLAIGGSFPLVTWMTYLCAGMAIGRLNLRWLLTQTRLIVLGATVAITSTIASNFLVFQAGGFDQIYSNTPDYSREDLLAVMDYGPYDHMPTDTLWWLTITGPHTDTPFELFTTAGLAVCAIGSLLVIARMLNNFLLPLIAAGSMTLTLYVVHLLIFAIFGETILDKPNGWFWGQISFGILLASAWYLGHGKGPLESLVSRICRWLGTIIVPNAPSPVTVKADDPTDDATLDVNDVEHLSQPDSLKHSKPKHAAE